MLLSTCSKAKPRSITCYRRKFGTHTPAACSVADTELTVFYRVFLLVQFLALTFSQSALNDPSTPRPLASYVTGSWLLVV